MLSVPTYTNRIRSLFLSLSLAATVLGSARPALAGPVGAVSACGRKLCLIAGGVACLPLQVVEMGTGQMGIREGNSGGRDRVFGVSNRTALHYLDAMGLWTYDLRGKTILDIGSGKSRFVQTVNIAYAGSGARATGVDLLTDGPLIGWPGNYVRGDAFALPVADKSQDLTLNNWLATYFLRANSEISRDELQRMLNEQLRVTKDSGDARINLVWKAPPGSDAQKFISETLRANPRVESFTFVRQWPFRTFLLAIKMKPAGLTPELAAAEPSEHYSHAINPFSSAMVPVAGYAGWSLLLR